MTTGTKIFLAVFASFIGVLVLYYGVLMPEAQSPPAVSTTRNIAAPQDDTPDATTTEHAVVPPPSDPMLFADLRQPVLPIETAQQAVASDGGPIVHSNLTQADAPPSPTVHPAESPASPQSTQPIANQPLNLGGEPSAPTSTKREPSVSTPTTSSRTSGVPSTSTSTTEYAVKSGDTMTSIAEDWFGDSNKWSMIAKANPLVDPNRLRVGQKLRLPPKDAKPVSVKESSTGSQPQYLVRSGDTLAKIAREYYGDVGKWKTIYDANRTIIGSDPANLKPGMKLKLPPPSKPASS